MVFVIPLVPSSLGGVPEQWQSRLMNYAAGERPQGTIENLLEDLTPQLGGDLDLNGSKIVDGAQEIIEWTGSILNLLGEPLFIANIGGGVSDGHVLIYNSSSQEWDSGLQQANAVAFDDTVSSIGESDVQGALDFIVANGGGGGGGILSLYADKSPQLGGILQLGHPTESTRDFQDHNGANMVTWGANSGAVNFFQISNAATGLPPTLRAQGTDSIVDLQLLGKGATCKVICATDLKFSGTIGNKAVVDSASADLLRFIEVGSAENYLDILNAAAGNSPGIRSTGLNDTDVNLGLNTKGDGHLVLGGHLDLALNDHEVWDRNSAKMLTFKEDAASVNYWELGNADAGSNPFLAVTGTDPNPNMLFNTKGAGAFIFRSNAGVDLNKAFRVACVTSGENYVQVTQAVSGGNPIVRARGDTDADIDLILAGKGAGLVKIGTGQVVSITSPVNGDIFYYNSGFQRLPVGANGEVLTLGAGIPSWVAGGGGGGDMLAAVYDPGAITEQLVGETATQTLSNKALSAPQIDGTGPIRDQNANSILSLQGVGSAVDYFRMQNAAVGNPLEIFPLGTTTNVGLKLLGKGTGRVIVGSDLELQSTDIYGTNQNIWLKSTDVASAVNHPRLFNSVTGEPVQLAAEGSDSNIDLVLAPKVASLNSARVRIADQCTFQLGSTLVYGKNGNKACGFNDAGDGNYCEFIGIGTGNPATMRAVGVDSNVDLRIYGKGTGIAINLAGAEYNNVYQCEVVGTAGTVITTSETAVQLASISQRAGDTEVFVLSTVNDDITLPPNTDGFYEIVCILSNDKSNSGAGWIEIKIQTDTSGAFVDVPDTDFRGDTGGTSHGYAATRASLNLNGGDKIRFRHNSSHATLITVRRCRAMIRRIGKKTA